MGGETKFTQRKTHDFFYFGLAFVLNFECGFIEIIFQNDWKFLYQKLGHDSSFDFKKCINKYITYDSKPAFPSLLVQVQLLGIRHFKDS